MASAFSIISVYCEADVRLIGPRLRRASAVI